MQEMYTAFNTLQRDIRRVSSRQEALAKDQSKLHKDMNHLASATKVC